MVASLLAVHDMRCGSGEALNATPAVTRRELNVLAGPSGFHDQKAWDVGYRNVREAMRALGTRIPNHNVGESGLLDPDSSRRVYQPKRPSHIVIYAIDGPRKVWRVFACGEEAIRQGVFGVRSLQSVKFCEPRIGNGDVGMQRSGERPRLFVYIVHVQPHLQLFRTQRRIKVEQEPFRPDAKGGCIVPKLEVDCVASLVRNHGPDARAREPVFRQRSSSGELRKTNRHSAADRRSAFASRKLARIQQLASVAVSPGEDLSAVSAGNQAVPGREAARDQTRPFVDFHERILPGSAGEAGAAGARCGFG